MALDQPVTSPIDSNLPSILFPAYLNMISKQTPLEASLDTNHSNVAPYRHVVAPILDQRPSWVVVSLELPKLRKNAHFFFHNVDGRLILPLPT